MPRTDELRKRLDAGGMERRTASIDRVDGRTLHGYAARYDNWSNPLFHGTAFEFKERIQRGAFDESIAKGEVSLFWQHNREAVLANQSSGTLKLFSDDVGLRYEATLGDTPQDDLYLDRVARGIVREMSFGFNVPDGGDSWNKAETERTLLKVRLREISVVERGAYPGTSAGKRDRSQPMAFKSSILGLAGAAFTAALANTSFRDLRDARNELRTILAESLEDGSIVTEEVREEWTSMMDELRAEINSRTTRATSAAARIQREDPDKSAERAGNQLDTKEYRSAFDNHVRMGGKPPELREVTTSTSSGLFVPKQYADAIEKYALANLIIRNKCNYKANVIGKPAFRVSGIRHNTKADAITTEGGSSTSVDPSLAEVTPTPIPVIAHTQYTTTLMVSSDFDVEEMIVDELGKKVQNGIENYLSNGTDSGQPYGVFKDNSSTNQQATTAAHGSGAGWDSQVDAIANTQAMAFGLIPAAYWANMEWFMSQDYFARWASKVDSAGRPLMQASGIASASGGPVFLLHGRPVNVAAFAPGRQTAASATVPCVLGNLREAYKALEWGGIPMILRDEITVAGKIITRMQTHIDGRYIKPGYMAQHKVTLT